MMLRTLTLAFALVVLGATGLANAQTFDEAMARGEAAFSAERYRDARGAFQEALDLADDANARARATTGVARAWWRSDPPTWRGDMNGSRNRVRPNREAPRLLLGVMTMIEDGVMAEMLEPGVGPHEAAYAEAIAWLNLMRAEARSVGWPELLRPSEQPAFLSLEQEDARLCDGLLVFEPEPYYPDAEAMDWRSGAVVLLVETTADNRLALMEIAGAAGPASFPEAVSNAMKHWTLRPVEAGETCGREGVQFLQITFARRNGAALGLEYGTDWFAPRGSNRY